MSPVAPNEFGANGPCSIEIEPALVIFIQC